MLAGAPAPAQQGDDLQSSLLSPALDGSPPMPPRFRAVQNPKPNAPARFGQVPTFSYQQGIGIGSTGFDSKNGAKRKGNASKSKPGVKPAGTTAATNTQQQPNTGTTTIGTAASVRPWSRGEAFLQR
jgi:hypothetical protein